jgi:hypothetical protein
MAPSYSLAGSMSEEYRQVVAVPAAQAGREQLPPAWREFIRFCRDLGHGQIERLNIQDGVPVLAEVVTRKVKFNRDH